jgi:hypothetical protein
MLLLMKKYFYFTLIPGFRVPRVPWSSKSDKCLTKLLSLVQYVNEKTQNCTILRNLVTIRTLYIEITMLDLLCCSRAAKIIGNMELDKTYIDPQVPSSQFAETV